MEYKKRARAALLIWLAAATALAGVETEEPADANATWVDETHRWISREIVDWADRLDATLASWLGGEEDDAEEGNRTTELMKERRTAERFFQTRKYLNETPNAYIRARLDAYMASKESGDVNARVSLHLPLVRAQRRLRLFVEDFNDENAKEVTEKTPEGSSDTSPKFGLNYFAPRAFGIVSKYSLGFSGLYPYARARYNTVFQPGGWAVEPVQTFRYSTKDEFAEQTDLYCDTEVSEDSIFRIHLLRGTRSHKDGMYYGAAVSFSHLFTPRRGLRLVQSFSGDTDYEYTPEGETESRTYSGIYNYTTALGYRTDIWRHWLFVEVVPAVNFHKEYGYSPNYSLRFYLDLFFGNYR